MGALPDTASSAAGVRAYRAVSIRPQPAIPQRRSLARRLGIVADPRVVVGGSVILVISTLAILAPWLIANPPDLQNPVYRLAKPGAGLLLGGDALGRDTFSRLVFAGRISLSVGVVSMLITIVLGVAVGAVAGYYGGWADRILMRMTDIVLVFPTFFLLVFIVATFGRSVPLLIAMIGLTSWPTNARVVRAAILRLRDQDFVTAARVAGAGDTRLVIRHLLPHLLPVVIASATIRVANNILIESGLSYLGLGVQPPTPTWGNMVSDATVYMRQAPWMIAIPGFTIFMVVLAFNLLGEGLRNRLDPRRRGR